MAEQFCVSCRFWGVSVGERHVEKDGVCRRHAPILSFQRWPETQGCESCGDWELTTEEFEA